MFNYVDVIFRNKKNNIEKKVCLVNKIRKDKGCKSR